MTTRTLSTDDLRHAAPSIFATTPWEGMSNNYRFIPTGDVLDRMADQGFRVTKAVQSRSRIPGKAPFTRHLLRLRHVDFLDTTEAEVPEVVLINSHDRSSAYKLFTGIMRFVCENGMIVQSSDFGSFSIRHSGSRDLYQQIMEATDRIMEGVPTIMGRIADWKQVILPRIDQLELARQAMELKPNAAVPFHSLLTSRRVEDDTDAYGKRDLWKTANVLQESLMRGGIQGRNVRGRQIRTRPVKAVEADVRINRKLWELAEGFSVN